MQKEEYLIKNACYSVTKYYLCKQNNKRSLLGRKQRSQVARSFPNRYQFSCTNKVTSLFSISCILRIIFSGEVVSLFRDDPDVISIGIPALRYQMIIFSACSFMMMANMMMQTCRKTIRANILAASRQGLFFIPLIFVLPYFYGLFGVEICQAVSDIISLIVTIPIVWSAFKEMK